jgi:hypothetical protein
MPPVPIHLLAVTLIPVPGQIVINLVPDGYPAASIQTSCPDPIKGSRSTKASKNKNIPFMKSLSKRKTKIISEG